MTIPWGIRRAAARAAGRAIAALLALAPVAGPPPAHGWGGTGHRAVAAHYSENLPGALDGLRQHDAWVLEHVMDADARKAVDPAERYRHYIDIDAYPEYHQGTLPHDRAVLEARYGAAQVEQWGVAPWAIGAVVDSMTRAMARADWSRVRVLLADLCHYVGDLHQPLHCTLNYDGQLTGNHGIHYRYESRMLDLDPQLLQLDAGTVTYHPDAVDAAFAIAGASQVRVPIVLEGDNAARQAAGGSISSPAYYAELWNRTGAMTLDRLTEAAVATASLVYSAWLDAGAPTVPGSSVGADPPGDAAGGLGLAAEPSPARGTIRVRYRLPADGPVTLAVYDAAGRRVATLLHGRRAAGAGSLTWRPSRRGAAPGVYFLRLEQLGRRAGVRVVQLP